MELRIWNIFQVKDGVYNLSGLSKLSLVLKRYDLTSWKKTTWSQNIKICNIEKMIPSSYFYLLNKVGKTWGLCWVGDLAKEKFCKFRQFVFFTVPNLVQLQGKVIISHNRWVWRLAGTSLLLCDSICWALDINWLLRIVTISGFVTAASTFSRDKMKIKEQNQPRPERPQCQAQPLFPPSEVLAGFNFTKLLHSWSPSHQGDH